MSRDDALVLDIVLAATDAIAFVQDLDWPAFEASRLHQNAVVRSLEIIGEAACKLSSDFTAVYPAIPWRNIINTRHRLIHAYSDVRLDIVWRIVKQQLPLLVAQLQPLVPPNN